MSKCCKEYYCKSKELFYLCSNIPVSNIRFSNNGHLRGDCTKLKTILDLSDSYQLHYALGAIAPAPAIEANLPSWVRLEMHQTRNSSHTFDRVQLSLSIETHCSRDSTSAT